jgi:hypothetical protein
MTRSASDTDRLLVDADNAAALAHKLRLIKIEADHRLAWYRSHFNPDQPRVPAGRADGGQWTRTGAGGNDPRILSDAAPDQDWKPGAQYAQSRGRGSVPVRIGGRVFDVEPGQAARLAVAEARIQDAIIRVRAVEPSWRPKLGAYATDIEGEIRKLNDVADEAQARIAELGRNGIGPGPFAGESIPARGTGRDFTAEERREINRIGSATGCHTCGTFEPGTKSRNFVPDHQFPNALNPPWRLQRLYPQCVACSDFQGGWIRGLIGRH